MSKLNGLDLFSGIGGISVALEPWVRPVAYCESDRHAQSVLLSRMSEGAIPIAPVWDDVRTLHCGDFPSLDIVYGGFPCQDVSVAGDRAGLDGERSGLVFELLRLVGTCRPRFVFLENVAALAVRGLDRVLLELDALGYDARWTIVSAAEVGAPHSRERIWILAHANGHANGHALRLQSEPELGGSRALGTGFDGAQEPLANSDGVREPQFAESGDCARNRPIDGGEDLAYPSSVPSVPRGLSRRAEQKQSWAGVGGQRGCWDGQWTTEPDVGRVAHGVPDRVDRLRGLGNAVVPQAAREAFMRLTGLQA